MDLLLADERSMQAMAREYERLNVASLASAAASALSANISADVPSNEDDPGVRKGAVSGVCGDAVGADKEDKFSPKCEDGGENTADIGAKTSAVPARCIHTVADGATQNRAALRLLFLYLYFIKGLGYNNRYGTQIYDAQRGLGGLRPDNFPFREFNDILG